MTYQQVSPVYWRFVGAHRPNEESQLKAESVARYFLGVSCYYHDSAAVLLKDGVIIAAAQEERFTRVKHDNRFPVSAVRYCLQEAGIHSSQVERVLYYEDPVIKFKRIVGTVANFGWRAAEMCIASIPEWLSDKLYIKRRIRKAMASAGTPLAKEARIEYVPHHESHAASAFFPSPFDRAAVLCIDGVGEWATTSVWLGEGNQLKKLWEIRFPHSLGLLYSAFTYFCGFKVDSGEYKLMGLAPYGKPIYADLILKHLVDVKDDGTFWLNMEYFDFAVGEEMTTAKFDELLGGPRRLPESALTTREFDLAASIQKVLEEIVLKLARTVRNETGAKRLCMAGGVALNCVANGKLAEAQIFDAIWVQPAAGDAGGALGAAYTSWYTRDGNPRAVGKPDAMQGSLLGPAYEDNEVEHRLKAVGAAFEKIEGDRLPSHVAALIDEGCVIGWFQGRMEFGPRSLGSRSILGDPRNPTMQSVMNIKIKNRESFRPFAPAVLEGHAEAWFDVREPNPYMLFVSPVTGSRRIRECADDAEKVGIEKLKVPRSTIPAVTHVDHSARVQVIDARSNRAFRSLAEAFHKRTGCPVLVNTSFNVRGEPIVESPEDAYRCFMRTSMDYLIVNNYVLRKKAQPEWIETNDWRTEFALD